MISLPLIALIVALVLFVLAACNTPSRPNLTALGLAFVVVYLIAGRGL